MSVGGKLSSNEFDSYNVNNDIVFKHDGVAYMTFDKTQDKIVFNQDTNRSVDMSSFYTKSEIDTSFSSYYTKQRWIHHEQVKLI